MPLTEETRRFDHAVRRLEEVRAWRHAREFPIQSWQFTPASGQTSPLQLMDFWPVVETPVRLTASTTIPEEFSGQRVELELWLGGEGFVRLSTGLQGGLNALHHSFPVADAAQGGESLTIDAEVVPKGMFGTHLPDPRIERAHLVVPQSEVRDLERDLTMIVEACLHLGEHEVVPFLLDIVDAAFVELNQGWPSATDVAVTRLVSGYRNAIGSGLASVPPRFAREAAEVRPGRMGLWSLPPAPRPLEPLSDDTVAAVGRARAVIAEHLDRVKQEYPPVGRIALTGHAHIDLAWLWPLAETRRKARRTFSSVLWLMERYEDFTFNQSSAQAYAWMEEDDPDLLPRIQERVAEGRWEPIGGSWTEPDCQVTGGEAFVRQLLYGQRYFEEKFGKRSTVAWLPDVFGFSGGIPQLLRGAGITGFFTTKLNWNEANTFPYDLFEWEGLDGTRVTSHTFLNPDPGLGYNGNIAPADTLNTWRNFRGKRKHPESLLAFGWGDGGGGPTEKMLENYQRLKNFPALPRLRMGLIEEFFAALPKQDLPTWVGELYLEYHRGTLTSQAKVKAFNRTAEHRLLEAEVFAAIAHLHGFEYPRPALEAAWKSLLLNQFHDILPGSSIAEVYVDAHRELSEVVETATQVRDWALSHLGGLIGGAEGSKRVLVANAALTPRPLCVVLAGHDTSTVITNASGEPLPTQATEQGLLVFDPSQFVPAVGWTSLTLASQGGQSPSSSGSRVRAEAHADGALIENDLLTIEIGGDGSIRRAFDKEAKRDIFDGRGNQLWAYVDRPRVYDAWDIEETYEREAHEVGGVERIEVVETGPLRAAVRVARTWRDSRIEQTYRLLAGSKRLDVETHIDWHERQMLIKARFPFAVHTHEATYETMYGVQRRPTHRNTPWDAARYEVSGQRFADFSEPGYGVALLNDSKYGHGAHENVLTLSLIRGPMYPDLYADEGHHHFTYSVLPHTGDWTESDVVQEAFALNSPLTVTPIDSNGTAQPAHTGFIETDGLPLGIGGMKRAENDNGIILRLYEPHGARGTATLRFSQGLQTVERVNLLEDREEDQSRLQTQDSNSVQLDVRPFEVVTLRLSL